jgi:hypothetical protein
MNMQQHAMPHTGTPPQGTRSGQGGMAPGQPAGASFRDAPSPIQGFGSAGHSGGAGGFGGGFGTGPDPLGSGSMGGGGDFGFGAAPATPGGYPLGNAFGGAQPQSVKRGSKAGLLIVCFLVLILAASLTFIALRYRANIGF